jgi:hypothetical protein
MQELVVAPGCWARLHIPLSLLLAYTLHISHLLLLLLLLLVLLDALQRCYC